MAASKVTNTLTAHLRPEDMWLKAKVQLERKKLEQSESYVVKMALKEYFKKRKKPRKTNKSID